MTHVQGADPPGQVARSARSRSRRPAPARSEAPCSWTCARPTSGRRATCPAPSSSPAASWSCGSRRRCPTRPQEVVALLRGRHAQRARPRESLQDLGYTNVASMAGGFGKWKEAGLPIAVPRTLTAEQKQRYSRHLLVPEVGEAGQAKLLDVEGAAGRRGRPGLARRPLPGRGRRGHDRRRRLRRGGPLEPAAPGPAHQRVAWASPRRSRRRPRSARSTPT